MAHFAELNENNKVIRVVVVENYCILNENNEESEELGISYLNNLYNENLNWKQTSYNNNFRNVFGGPGFSYDETLDAFISPKPYPSWILNETTITWKAPVPEPTDVPEGSYYEWNEEEQSWELITPPTE